MNNEQLEKYCERLEERIRVLENQRPIYCPPQYIPPQYPEGTYQPICTCNITTCQPCPIHGHRVTCTPVYYTTC